MAQRRQSRGLFWSLMFASLVTALTCNGLIMYAGVQTVTKNQSLQNALQKEGEATLQAIAAKKATARAAAIAEGYVDPLTITNSCNTLRKHNNPASMDVLVNKKHCLIPESYVPADLETRSGVTLSAKAMPHFQAMLAAATAAGKPLYVTSSYRSYDDQVSTYAYWIATSGQQGADTYSARPGYSEHQTGFVVDVASNGCVLDCFGNTPAYTWLHDHAAEYGFIQRYYAGSEAVTGYKAEEWHYRYVGVTTAKDMNARSIKTLEEYWGINGGDYNGT